MPRTSPAPSSPPPPSETMYKPAPPALARLTVSNTMLGLAMLFVALLGVSSSGYRELVAKQGGEGITPLSIAMALATVLFCLLPWGLAGLARGRGEKASARYNGVFSVVAWVLLVIFSIELFGSGLMSLKAAVTGTVSAQVQPGMPTTDEGADQRTEHPASRPPPIGPLGSIGTAVPSFEAERRMIESMRRTSARVSEPQQSWLRITADWLDELCNRHEAISKASKGMRSFRDPVWIESSDQIRAQHRIHQRANAANDALIAWLLHAENQLLKDFARSGRQDDATLRSVRQFLGDLNIEQRIALAQADREACTTAEHMGELLEFAWGGWLYDTQRNTVVFDSSRVAEAWNALDEQLRGAERMRAEAEASLLNAPR